MCKISISYSWHLNLKDKQSAKEGEGTWTQEIFHRQP